MKSQTMITDIKRDNMSVYFKKANRLNMKGVLYLALQTCDHIDKNVNTWSKQGLCFGYHQNVAALKQTIFKYYYYDMQF